MKKAVLKGAGNSHPDYDKPGDLIIILIEKPNKYYAELIMTFILKNQ